MPKFKIGDHVRVLRNTSARKGELGTVISVTPNRTEDDRLQSYIVRFDTANGRVLEHYLQYELYLPLSMKQRAMTSK